MTDPDIRVTRKIRRRIVLPLTALLVVSSLDRSNIGIAALQMNADLGLTPKDYGTAVTVFFAGYLVCQFPSMWLLGRVGARRWVGGLVLLWGLAAAATALVRDATTLHALRFLLGAAEAGFAPGVVFLCSRWMPRRFRASAIGLTMLAVPVSVIAGAPLSGWLMSQPNALGLAGWRWMFLAQGALTVLFAVLAVLTIVEGPESAAWLSTSERRWLATRIAADDAAAASAGSASVRSILRSGRLWAAGGVWFVLVAGAYGILFWLPQVVRQMAGRSVMETSLISAMPWIGIGLGMVVNARHSDRTGERPRHVALPMLVCSASLALATLVPSQAVALACLVLAGVGLGAAQSVFWTIPIAFLGPAAARPGITAINLLGNVGGLIGPYAIGALREATGSFVAPVHGMAALLVGGAVLLRFATVSTPAVGARRAVRIDA